MSTAEKRKLWAQTPKGKACLRTYRVRHRDKQKMYQKNWLRRAKELGRCLYGGCKERATVGKSNCELHCRKRADYLKLWRKDLRIQVIHAYGGPCCACCGELQLEFLSIDHINSDGAAHRKQISTTTNMAGYNFYLWLRRNNYPLGFQVLCMNCQYLKREEAHETRR